MIENPIELLTTEAAYKADRLAEERGISGFRLMRTAGEGGADLLQERWPKGAVVVLAGPGNNGGDGFVVAERLKTLGRDVKLGLLGNVGSLKGDAATAHSLWRGETQEAQPSLLDGADIIVDALFGAGLDRPLEGLAAELVDTIAEAKKGGAAVLSVDMPSGVHGDTGQVMGTAVAADLTVTFFRKKPGHVLVPGRWRCGDVRVIDIGIPESVLPDLGSTLYENGPTLWRGSFPHPQPGGHKYHRGHALVMSGPAGAGGAARLAARAALRVGAGLVTVLAEPAAMAEHAARLDAVMLRPVQDVDAFDSLLDDPRFNAVLLGPGNGVTEITWQRALAALRHGKKTVLDADALTVFADGPKTLYRYASEDIVLTPHAGEFSRVFPDIDASRGKIVQVQEAARRCGAVVLLKGPDTVVAAPDGRVSVATNAPPTLATAGSGDVLAGLVTGLLAQGMSGFEAASAAVWLHGEAAEAFGPGLISEDLEAMLPGILRQLD